MKIRIFVLLTLGVLVECQDVVSTTESTLEVEKTEEESLDIKDPETPKDKLPILPPIILLDFGDDSDNSTSSDEKSKRTTNNELGYGYLENNLVKGKFNYYFPGGKSGTSFSIEESISPFKPKTIIETYKTINDRPDTGSSTISPDSSAQVDQPQAQAWSAPYPGHQPAFGQRTKLRKEPPADYIYQNTFSSTPKSNIGAYTTIKPQYGHRNGAVTEKPVYQSQYKGFTTTPAYNSRFVAGLNPVEPSFDNRPLSSDPSAFNLPRYTVENGIQYEHKIVWKYPDGRIANPPATSYINSRNQYGNEVKTQVNHQNRVFPSAAPFHSSPEVPYRNENLKGPYQSPNAYQSQQNIHSQRPAQFPSDSEPATGSSGSAQSQGFDFSYQNNYGLRQRGNGNVKYTQKRPVSKYAVDSANAEYTSPSFAMDDGQLSPEVRQKYSPQVQNYLTKVFPGSKPEMQFNGGSEAFIKNNYQNLLNYNPSISQYIQNPASILHAQPTFIQAGNSLVPVIILRVDGARPIQKQPTNINLKSLLQQYLAEYTGSKLLASDYRSDGSEKSELGQLTQALKRFSSNNHREAPFDPYSARYQGYEGAQQSFKKSQKVKNVQIIENPPRYSSDAGN